jgi:putative flippase GtrA
MRALLSRMPAQVVELSSFIATGMLNTCFGYCVYALMVLAGFRPPTALLIATVMGVAFNFFTFGKVVFKRLNWRRVPQFLVIYAVNYLGSIWILSAVQKYIRSPYLAYLVVIPFSVTFLYLALRRFVFGSRA